jgi:hypothetical protein
MTAWTCPPHAGCDWDTLLPVIQNVRAAGIVVVAGAGGGGPGCGTIDEPPAIYDEATTVGATSQADVASSFGGRGPVRVDFSGRTKPDISAPGIDILSSSLDGGYAYYSGTSMAVPHIAGLVALLVTAAPELAGDVAALESAMNGSAVPLMSNQCGDGDAVPNNVYGHGRIDALAACTGVPIAVPQLLPSNRWPAARLLPSVPNPFNPRTTLHYELDRAGFVDLRVYDSAGRLVRVLVRHEAELAGRHTAVWDGRDDRGRPVAAGIYVGRLSIGAGSSTQRLALIR